MSEKQTSTDEKTYTLEELAGEANGQEPLTTHMGQALADGRYVTKCNLVLPRGGWVHGRVARSILCRVCHPKT